MLTLIEMKTLMMSPLYNGTYLKRLETLSTDLLILAVTDGNGIVDIAETNFLQMYPAKTM